MTTTADWLAAMPGAELAFVVAIDGLPLFYTTTNKQLTGAGSIQAAWGATDWDGYTPRQGLNIIGETGGKIVPFDAKVESEALTIAIVDLDDALATSLFKMRDANALTTHLTADCDSDDMTLNVGPLGSDWVDWSDGLVYCGLETFYCEYSDANSLTVDIRGMYSVWGTDADPSHFSRSHRLNANGYGPKVSTSPYTHTNRPIAVYLHHYEDGAWCSRANAQLVWTGQIKAIADNAGQIELACESVHALLAGRLMAPGYSGTLAEGMYLRAEDAGIAAMADYVVEGSDPPAGAHFPSGGGYVIAALPGLTVGTWVTAADVAVAINTQLATWAHAGSLGPTSPLDPSWRIQRAPGLVNLGVYITNTVSPTQTWHYFIYLSPWVWRLLGGNSDEGSDGVCAMGAYLMLPMELGADGVTSAPPHILPNVPLKWTTKNLLTTVLIAVSDEVGTFGPQPTMPPGIDPSLFIWEGFLKVGDAIMLVKRFPGYGFYSKNIAYWGVLGGSGSTWDPGAEIREDNAGPIAVQQVWIEGGAGSTADLIRRMAISTGTLNYNHGYDIYPRGMAIGVPSSLIDHVSWKAQLDQLSPYMVVVTEPTPFLDILESALNALNCACVWRAGKLALVPACGEGAAEEAVCIFDEDNKAMQIQGSDGVTEPQRTTSQYSADRCINEATLSYDRDLNGKYLSTDTVTSEISIDEVGIQKSVKSEGIGIYSDALGGGSGLESWRLHVGATSLAYFGVPWAEIDRSFDASLAFVAYLGARCGLTDLGVIDPTTGLRGVAQIPVWVLAFSFDWRTGAGKVILAFTPSAVPFHLWAPSAAVDEGASNGGLGVDNKTLTCHAHSYSGALQATDVSWFAAGDKVVVLQLGVAAPKRWIATIDVVDAVANTITLSATLSAPPWASGAGYRYVVQFDDIVTDVARERAFCFIADDVTGSTGLAASDAYVWGLPPTDLVVSTAEACTTRYRQLPTSVENPAVIGEPLSVHKVHDAAKGLACLWNHASDPIYVNASFLSTARPVQTGSVFLLVYGPLRFQTARPTALLGVIAYAKVSAGAGHVKVRACLAPPTGASFAATVYGEETQEVDITITSTSLAYSAEYTMPAPPPRDGFDCFYVTVEIANAAGGAATITLGGVTVRELPL